MTDAGDVLAVPKEQEEAAEPKPLGMFWLGLLATSLLSLFGILGLLFIDGHKRRERKFFAIGNGVGLLVSLALGFGIAVLVLAFGNVNWI